MRLCSNLLGLMILLVSTHGYANTMVIEGSNPPAKQCYRLAERAQTVSTEFADLDVSACSEALNYSTLRRRDRVATLVNRGILYLRQQAFSLAEADFHSAAGLSQNNAEIQANLGNLRFLQGRFTTALQHYDRALELQVRRPQVVYLNRGLVLERQGDLSAALQSVELSLSLAPAWQRAKQVRARLKLKIER